VRRPSSPTAARKTVRSCTPLAQTDFAKKLERGATRPKPQAVRGGHAGPEPSGSSPRPGATLFLRRARVHVDRSPGSGLLHRRCTRPGAEPTRARLHLEGDGAIAVDHDVEGEVRRIPTDRSRPQDSGKLM